jgi:hypothetical protein
MRSTATRASNPDDDYGWGIVQGMAAASLVTSTPPVERERAAISFWAAPNPSRDDATLRFDFPHATDWLEISIHDVTGRRLRWLDAKVRGDGGTATWDGRDDEGRPVAAGVYYARLRTADGETTARIVRLR